ncbi:MAG: ABC transporter permease [Firmicutes bacterium]|nr:ABC transporter permease [Bacillota bacterium]
MAVYILKRILIAILIVFLVSVFAKALMHMLPGDPVRLAMGFEAKEEDVEAFRVRMNLDKPIHMQYILWVKGLFKGDMGWSVLYDRPNRDIFAERLPRSIAIGLPAVIISSVFAIIFGIICAVNRGKWSDQIITFLMTLGLGTPVFWLGIFGIYIFAIRLRVLPIQGFTSPFVNFGEYVRKAILPVACMSIPMIAGVARQTRTNMLDAINQDYVRTARAYGISERKIQMKYALKNALIPVVTIIGLQLRIVIGGSVLIENVFNIPGIGSLLVTAINNRDYFVVQNAVLLISIFTVSVNLLVDILYGFIDPKIRLERKGG